MKYKMPTKSDLKGRSSTMSNAFAISITPYIVPSEEEVKASYDLLQIQEGQCAYCLGEGNAKDHLKPLVKMGLPTGYITAINNLVPCCSQCNSSKGAKTFEEWYLSTENLTRLKRKGMSDSDIEQRFRIISEYESHIEEPLNYEELLGAELWEQYQERKQSLLERLNEDQEFCDMLSSIIMGKIKAEDYGRVRKKKENQTMLSGMIAKINSFKSGNADRRWKMKDQELVFDNEYITVVRVDSSNKWVSSTEMEKQWGIIFIMKKDFTHLPKYKELSSHCDIAVTPVRTGKNAGCYGLRVYRMRRDPDEKILTEILDYIFS